MKTEDQRYVGIHNDLFGGVTDTGRIIRDARAFGIVPETETCEGGLAAGIEDLWRKVDAEWEKCGYRVAALPPDVQTRHLRIQDSAVRRARDAGWNPERGNDDRRYDIVDLGHVN